MMGNENSQLSGLEIEEKAVEITDFWCHYQAKINDSCRYFSLKSDGSVSVFKGEAAAGPLWSVSTPLEKFSNNLLKYRHPCIVRYISAWQQRSTLHLATEYVQPLSHVLNSLTPLQICIGLNNILQALVFLHEQAGMSHNNVCVASIYVTGDGQWKLGALQYLCAFNDLTAAYLKHARLHRYDKAVDPSEESYEVTSKVDQYSFAVLVDDVFKGRNDDDVPHLRDFKKYCQVHLQHREPSRRPALSEALQHSFFNHEFITIYKFLNFLPLKSEEERSALFSHIVDSLRSFDEETVAKQLSGLLLSRLTMLDHTARREVIPYILKPRNERPQPGECPGLFSLSVFKEHVKPRLMQLFGVRDSQIRMQLLVHFNKFVHVFSHDELAQHILPELLLGIKDTDDALVASTLICLSELVPILGASTVIGGKRSKHFTDGRPNSKVNTYTTKMDKPPEKTFIPEKSLGDLPCSETVFERRSSVEMFEEMLIERPSPVGGESLEEFVSAEKSSEIMNHFESEEDWSDWDNSNRQLTFETSNMNADIILNDDVKATSLLKTESDVISVQSSTDQIQHNTDKKTSNSEMKQSNTEKLQSNPDKIQSDTKASPISKQDVASRRNLLQKAALEAKKNIVDISELDIKNQKFDSLKRADEFDFFADMTPVIEKPSTVEPKENVMQVSSKLSFVPDEAVDESEAWGESWD